MTSHIARLDDELRVLELSGLSESTRASQLRAERDAVADTLRQQSERRAQLDMDRAGAADAARIAASAPCSCSRPWIGPANRCRNCHRICARSAALGYPTNGGARS